ncbi:PTS transporter subunit EIIB [Caloramator sp. mosi_1]
MNEFLQAATELIDRVGGLDNIISVQHCMTRLRLTLRERSLVNDEELKN